MVNYVNTVFVGKNVSSALLTAIPSTYATGNVGKFVIINAADGAVLTAATIVKAEAIKIGEVTAASTMDTKGVKRHVIKWSNVINRRYIKSYNAGTYTADTDEKVEIDFTSADLTELAKGNKRVIVRLTNKDTYTRYRKWTDSFEYVTAVNDDATKIADGLAKEISRNHKRARVTASASAGVLTLVALPYDDDDANDTINWANQVRFSANCYYTDPQAAGFASKNKYTINGATIEKTPAKIYQASAKLVRDRESWGMGYQGIINRGQCTWPIIKPDMMVDITARYDFITLEWENMYRAADDIQRHTKECVEVYEVNGKGVVKAMLDAWLGASQTGTAYVTESKADTQKLTA